MKRVIIYGCGLFFQHYKNDVASKYEVVGCVDANKDIADIGGVTFQCKKDVRYFNKKEYDYILLMVENIVKIFDIVRKLVLEEIDLSDVLLGISYYGKYEVYDDIGLYADGSLRLVMGSCRIKVTMPDEFYSANDIFINKCYSYYINSNKKEIVIDVGMNIGDSTLFFSRLGKVDKVIGYEPFEQAFKIAKKNLDEELKTGKVEIFKKGLGDRSYEKKCIIFDDMSTGLSTNDEYTNKSRYDRVQMRGSNVSSKKNHEIIEIEKASDAINGIITKYGDERNYILKMDCEGDEYFIIKDLYENKVLDKISYLMIEWHNNGYMGITKYLEKRDFVYHFMVTDSIRDRGMIYAFRNNSNI